MSVRHTGESRYPAFLSIFKLSKLDTGFRRYDGI